MCPHHLDMHMWFHTIYITRPDGKDTYMWDVVDADIRQLRAWANARADVLKKKAKTFKVVDM